MSQIHFRVKNIMVYSKFKEVKRDLINYLDNNQLGFKYTKTNARNYIWFSDFEEYFDDLHVHFEVIVEDNIISVDVHFENKNYNQELFDLLIGKLPANIVEKNWQGKAITHIKKFDLSTDIDISEIINCITELYEFTYPILINRLKEIFKEKSKDCMIIEANVKLLKYKNQIILQGPPGTGKTREAKLIAKEILGLASTDNLKNNEQFKIIQFHPSYTYEDFVRGIVATTNDEFLEYKTVNKILGDFARKANQTNLTGEVDDFERAWGQLVEDINENKVKKIGTSNVTIEINSQGNIKFASPVATFEKTYELYKFGKTDLKYETYQKIVLKYLKDTNGKYQLKDYVAPTETQSDKPYVLIIDEINRANLSSVLGELIYALEYRGQTVESIYSTLEDGHSLVLPNNLYIIGTMNTADRSVGHIDYAIRRRFAFVDVLPQKLQDDNEIYFNTNDFNKVSLLFNETNVSKEFEIDAVQIGHSYFIVKKKDVMNDEKRDELFKMKMKYEVKPILLEYVRDGILIGEYEGKKIKEYIKSL